MLIGSTFVQVGATRDGLDAYLDAAHRRGMTAVLVETPDYLRWRSALGRRPYDIGIAVDQPANTDALVAALRDLPAPALILAGFERYVASAYGAADILGSRPSGQSPQFQAPYKLGQRSAVSQTCAQIRQPRHATVTALGDLQAATAGLAFPVVVKPDNGGGGLGVYVAYEAANLAAIRTVLESVRNYDGGPFSGWIAEEYVPGVELSVQAVARDGKAIILTTCEKLTAVEAEPNGVGSFRESGHVARPGAEADPSLLSFVEACLGAVGYRTGPFHIDLIQTPDGELVLLEMGFRLSGMRVSELVTAVSGLDWAEEAFAAHLGTAHNGATARSAASYAGQLTLRQPSEVQAAQALPSAGGTRVDLQLFTAPSLPDEWDDVLPVTLRSDIGRHSGAMGRVVVSGDNPRTVTEVLHRCRMP
ncbi:ATP-grasp domain-containing protein [Hamadaea sp. NPDC051192]|uniref:ATP-grasp domain-containing protein n=1 Tax=Hamadaea sp. NPDC051192 TaxID=3154940 RepID=UPI00341C1E29